MQVYASYFDTLTPEDIQIVFFHRECVSAVELSRKCIEFLRRLVIKLHQYLEMLDAEIAVENEIIDGYFVRFKKEAIYKDKLVENIHNNRCMYKAWIETNIVKYDNMLDNLLFLTDKEPYVDYHTQILIQVCEAFDTIWKDRDIVYEVSFFKRFIITHPL